LFSNETSLFQLCSIISIVLTLHIYVFFWLLLECQPNSCVTVILVSKFLQYDTAYSPCDVCTSIKQLLFVIDKLHDCPPDYIKETAVLDIFRPARCTSLVSQL